MITAELIDHMGTDLSVVNAARVSFGKASELGCGHCGSHKIRVEGTWASCVCLNCGKETDDLSDRILSTRDTKLINYLASHKHMSPFGHCFASFHVKAPVFVARQLVKHKFLRINEVSRRYVNSDPEFYVPDVWRGVAADKKQGSSGAAESQYFPSLYCTRGNDEALANYRKMLFQGIAPEQARMILPQTMMTEWHWSGSLDAFADMCNLRCKEDTQYESRVVADVIDSIMQGLYPVSWRAIRGYDK